MRDPQRGVDERRKDLTGVLLGVGVGVADALSCVGLAMGLTVTSVTSAAYPCPRQVSFVWVCL